MRTMHLLSCSTLLALFATVLPSQNSLTSTFTTNNNVPTTGRLPSVSFDVTVTNPSGVVINRFDLNCSYVGIAAKLEVYMTALGGTHVGNLVTPAPGTWLLRSTASFTTAGAGTVTPAILDKPIVLAPGNYGVVR